MNITLPEAGVTLQSINMATTTRDYGLNVKQFGVVLYCDDYEQKERRIITARFHVTPTGKIRKNQTLEIELTRCAGYDAEKHVWGTEHYGNSWRRVTAQEATQLLELGDTIACSDKYDHKGTINHCTHYAKGA